MSVRHFNGYQYRSYKVANLRGRFWSVVLDGKERTFPTEKALRDHLRTLPRFKLVRIDLGDTFASDDDNTACLTLPAGGAKF